VLPFGARRGLAGSEAPAGRVLAGAIGLFPLLGLLLGGALGALGLLLDRALPPGPVAVALLALLFWPAKKDERVDAADTVGTGAFPLPKDVLPALPAHPETGERSEVTRA
jgi:hypothetical protein